MQWVDIGINLTNSRFDVDRQQVIDEAVAQGVTKLVITGTDLMESQKALALAKAYPDQLFATAGCHPHHAAEFDDDSCAKIEQLARHKQVVAIGECGLDFNRDFSPRNAQITAFKVQLELAIKLQKPVFLHERDAFDCQYQILTDYMPQLKGAVAHCFTGERTHLQKYLQLGLSIGITGWICDERRGQSLYQMLTDIPDDRLMLETDAPYLTPRNLSPKPKGGRNAPVFLPHIGQAVANARNQSLRYIAQISYRNSCQFFSLGEAS